MAVSLPGYHAEKSIQPWDFFIRVFVTLDFFGRKKFTEVQKKGSGVAGFIIAGWDENDEIAWWYSSVGDTWYRFDDDREAQYPPIYKKFTTIKRKIEKLREDPDLFHRVKNVGLAYWVHPEASDRFLDELVRITEGKQFPGSPHQ